MNKTCQKINQNNVTKITICRVACYCKNKCHFLQKKKKKKVEKKVA